MICKSKVNKIRFDDNNFICWFWLNGIMYSTLAFLNEVNLKNFDRDLVNSYRNSGGRGNGI